MAMSIAKFAYVRNIAGVDFKAQPSLDPKQIRDLATGQFIANGETLLLLGAPGAGKTHLAVFDSIWLVVFAFSRHFAPS
jgi:DNA replication protein DnaC